MSSFYDHMLDAGYSSITVDGARIIVKRYEGSGYKWKPKEIEKFIEANKSTMGYRTQQHYRNILTKYMEYITRGIKPLKSRKDYVRPMNCDRDCVYVYQRICRYKLGECLREVIVPKKCKHYEPRKKEPRKYEHDYMYDKRCMYKDSHSARWV